MYAVEEKLLSNECVNELIKKGIIMATHLINNIISHFEKAFLGFIIDAFFLSR